MRCAAVRGAEVRNAIFEPGGYEPLAMLIGSTLHRHHSTVIASKYLGCLAALADDHDPVQVDTTAG